MPAGPKRHRVIIQRDDGTTRSANGEVVPAWTSLATVWAEGGPLEGKELWNARQVKSEITHRFKVRYGDAIADLRGNVRLIFRDRTFTVVAALNLHELNWEWQLDCKEATDQAYVILDPSGSPILDPSGDVIRET